MSEETVYSANPGKQLVRTVDGVEYQRIPVKTHLITKADKMEDVVLQYAKDKMQAGDILFISEKAVACTQNRAIPMEDIKPRKLAVTLSRYVTKTPAGIGLGIPETMEMALRECGTLRILFAAFCSVIGKLLRRKGWFYIVAGPKARGIDGPTEGTIPPYDHYVVLTPADPMGTSKKLAQALGHPVAIVDINQEAAVAAAEELAGQYGADTMAVQCDVSQEEQVNIAVQKVLERFGTVDVLVNNAGILSLKKPFVEYTKADWDKIFGINFMGDVFFCKAVIPTMKEKKSGRIINMASQSAETGGLAASPIYAASKAAVWCMTKSLAGEMGPYQVTVNAVAPGYIMTEMTRNAGYRDDMVPMKRLGIPEDVADVVGFLASEDSRYVTGMIVDINGGTVMR